MSHHIDPDKCTLCQRCRHNCPMLLFKPGEKSMSWASQASERCMRCGHCIAVCPENAITIPGLAKTQFPPLPASTIDYPSLVDLLLTRRSIRKFKDQPVSQEHIEQILAAVATMPTGFGQPPPPICLVAGRERIAPLVQATMEFYRKLRWKMHNPITRLFMRLVLGRYQFAGMQGFLPIIDRMFEYYSSGGELDTITWGAPLLLIFHGHKASLSVDKDCSIACTYAMLAAHALGLGTTMIGVLPPYIEYTPQARQELQIPRDHIVVLALIVGHPDTRFSRGIRRPVTVNRIAELSSAEKT